MMVPLPENRLDKLEKKLELLETELSQNRDPDSYSRLASEYSEIKTIVDPIRELKKLKNELLNLNEMLSDPDLESELHKIAFDEKELLTSKIECLEKSIRILMLPKDASDEKNALLEIRAGTGGDEAAIFVGDLFRMYERYSAAQNWKLEIVSCNEGDAGGFKEIIVSISGKGVFSKLKFESGVHRVQRVPNTEASGRIHTSAATVAVLPEVEDIDIHIRSEDIRIDTMRASGAGGQHVNTTDSAVRITHIPSGITVIQAEKSQHQNRARAMQILRARLYDTHRSQANKERSETRKIQVGSGDRSERIRTYNFPQGRVTDHRINVTLYKLDRILQGEIDEFIDALITDYQSALLAEMKE